MWNAFNILFAAKGLTKTSMKKKPASTQRCAALWINISIQHRFRNSKKSTSDCATTTSMVVGLKKQPNEMPETYLTQAFTEHCCFKSYLTRFKIYDYDKCDFWNAEVGDAEHTLLMCGAWREERKVMTEMVNRVGWEVGDFIHLL